MKSLWWKLKRLHALDVDAFHERRFNRAGTFAYHCEFHGEKGGKDMADTIVVRGAAKK